MDASLGTWLYLVIIWAEENPEFFKFLKRWYEDYELRQGKPGITFIDEGDFLYVRKSFLSQEEEHILEDELRRIYLFSIRRAKSLREFCIGFHHLNCNHIKDQLEYLCEEGLMFKYHDRYFSLAVPLR